MTNCVISIVVKDKILFYFEKQNKPQVKIDLQFKYDLHLVLFLIV